MGVANVPSVDRACPTLPQGLCLQSRLHLLGVPGSELWGIPVHSPSKASKPSSPLAMRMLIPSCPRTAGLGGLAGLDDPSHTYTPTAGLAG
jgi:hypothetical protein